MATAVSDSPIWNQNQTVPSPYESNCTHTEVGISVFDIICMTLQFLLIIPITFGNVLVLLAIRKYSRLHVPTSVFIANLALADLMVGVLTIPVFAIVHHSYVGLEAMKGPCLASYVLSHGPTGVSMMTMFVIAIERYMAIHHPFYHSRTFTTRKARVVSVSLWIYVWVFISLLAVLKNKWTSDMNDCNFSSSLSGTYILILASHMLMIFVVTTVLYSRMGCTAWKHKKAIATQVSELPGAKNGQLMHNAKIAKMLALVLGLFYLCWVPYFISMPFAIMNSGEDPTWLHAWEQLAGIVVLANSCVNPIVYARKNRDFETAFKELLSRCARTGEFSSGLFNISSVASQTKTSRLNSDSKHSESKHVEHEL